MLDYDSLHRKGVSSIGNFFEHIIEATYTALLQGGDVAIDCGANVGRHTAPLSRCVGENGLVIAIEPIPSLAQKLVADCAKNVWVFPTALGREEKQEITFFVAQIGHEMSSLRSPVHSAMLTEEAKSQIIDIKVPLLTLNTLYKAHDLDEIRFIKMDIEGGEFHALMGADRILIQARPLIIFECGFGASADLFGFTREAFFDFFKRHGYRLFDLFGRPFDELSWGLERIPWYLMAVPVRSTDEAYVVNNHAKVVALVDQHFPFPG